MRCLITGASGFVGRQLCQQLINKYYLVAIVRTNGLPIDSNELIIKTINTHTDWKSILNGVDAVIHLANRAHVMNEDESDPYQVYKSINVDATANLARQAIDVGVKRFVYLSSVKVNGEFTKSRPFSESDQPMPEDCYGQTKHEAEEVLKTLCYNSSMELVIIRPPLVYGAGVKANFLNLIKLCNKSLPLPFGAIHNKRSFVYIENLTSLVETCLTHPKAGNQTFLVSDNDDQSTTELISTIKETLGRRKLLIPIPQDILAWVFRLLRKDVLAQRLIGSLRVDITKARLILGWTPPYKFKEGINKTVEHYNNDKTNI